MVSAGILHNWFIDPECTLQWFVIEKLLKSTNRSFWHKIQWKSGHISTLSGNWEGISKQYYRMSTVAKNKGNMREFYWYWKMRGKCGIFAFYPGNLLKASLSLTSGILAFLAFPTKLWKLQKKGTCQYIQLEAVYYGEFAPWGIQNMREFPGFSSRKSGKSTGIYGFPSPLAPPPPLFLSHRPASPIVPLLILIQFSGMCPLVRSFNFKLTDPQAALVEAEECFRDVEVSVRCTTDLHPKL